MFIDETGFHFNMSRRYAWSKRGEQAIVSEPFKKSNNHTLIGAMSLSGMRTSMLIEGAVDGEAFLVFLRHFLAPKIGKGTLVIMDNLPAHKIKGVRESIEATGAKLLYLPPFSPEYNPVEECWSKVKLLVRSWCTNNYQELIESIERAINSITKNDCYGWFKHAGYCF